MHRSRPVADIYTRVSTKIQEEEGSSLDTQEAAGRERCRHLGLDVGIVWREDHTGKELDERQMMSQLRRRIRERQIDVVVSYALDRLSRNQVHQAVIYYECQKHDVQIELVSEKLDDSPQGILLKNVMGFVAEIEREKITERTARGIRARVESGKIRVGSSTIYGYFWDNPTKGERGAYIIDPDAAQIVLRIFTLFVVKRLPMHAIAHLLQREHIPTPSQYLFNKGLLSEKRPIALEWRKETVARILKKCAYKGALVNYGNRVVKRSVQDGHGNIRKITSIIPRDKDDPAIVHHSEAACPAIVPVELWDKAQDMLVENKIESARKTNHPEQLLLRAGFIVCGHCHAKGRANFSPRDQRYYYRCGHTRGVYTLEHNVCTVGAYAVSAEMLDRTIWEDHVLPFIRNPQAVQEWVAYYRGNDRHIQQQITQQAESHQALLVQHQKKRDNLLRSIQIAQDPDTIETLTIALEATNRGIRQIQQELEQYTARQQQASSQSEQIEALGVFLQTAAARVKDMTHDQKRLLLKMLGVQVEIFHKGHLPNDARYCLHMTWEGLNAAIPSQLDEMFRVPYFSEYRTLIFDLPMLTWENIQAVVAHFWAARKPS